MTQSNQRFLRFFGRSCGSKVVVFIELERNSTILRKTRPVRRCSCSHRVYKNSEFMTLATVTKASSSWNFVWFFKNTRFYTIHSNCSVYSSVLEYSWTFIGTNKLYNYMCKITLCFWSFVAFWRVKWGFWLCDKSAFLGANPLKSNHNNNIITALLKGILIS